MRRRTDPAASFPAVLLYQADPLGTASATTIAPPGGIRPPGGDTVAIRPAGAADGGGDDGVGAGEGSGGGGPAGGPAGGTSVALRCGPWPPAL